MYLAEAMPEVARDDVARGEGPWELPEGWVWAGLGRVLPLAYGKALPERDREAAGNYKVYGSSGVVGSHDAFIAPPCSIIVGRKGSAGAVFFSNDASWANRHRLFHLRIASRRHRLWLLVLDVQKAGPLDQSTAIPSLSRDIYSAVSIPLAPLAEQRRIVARIDELFAEIAEGEAALREARKGLDLFRRALLKSAVTGELTKDWRAANCQTETGRDRLALIAASRRAGEPMKGRSRRGDVAPIELARLPGLPEGLGLGERSHEIAAVIGGLTKNPDRERMPLRAPYLRVANVQMGCLDLKEIKEIGVTEDDRRRASLSPGDLLIVEGNGSIDQIGRCAIWNNEIIGCVHQNHIIKVRFPEHWLSRWCLTWLLSPLGRSEIERLASSTSGLHTLSISKVEAIPVPILAEAEAAEISRRVSDALTAATDTEGALDAEAADAARLRQSVLKAAFEGRLVAQDPEDEPASSVLERLTAARRRR